MTTSLKEWNKQVFGNLFKKKRRILNRIVGIQKVPSYGENPFLEDLEENRAKKLESILDQEELMWLQKSKQQWIVDGDRNTHYYHTKTATRRRKNRIVKLRKDNGAWCEDPEEIKMLAMEFYRNLYIEKNNENLLLKTSLTYPQMDEQHKLALIDTPSCLDIYKAVASIGSLKAPREDGFPAIFFKENWQVVKDSFTRFVISL
ncbi:hypothetical protein AHAS_Ahas03G0287200 [Arachis hypogaea]